LKNAGLNKPFFGLKGGFFLDSHMSIHNTAWHRLESIPRAAILKHGFSSNVKIFRIGLRKERRSIVLSSIQPAIAAGMTPTRHAHNAAVPDADARQFSEKTVVQNTTNTSSKCSPREGDT
jgi:hypothetical protein